MSQEIITADVGGGSYELAPSGNQIVTCVGLHILGTLNETYEGHEKKTKKLILAFELVETSHVFNEEKGPEPFILTREFTHNLSSKSNLRKLLDNWSGVKLTDATAETFNLASLIGFSGLGNVIHDKRKKDGSDYAALNNVSPVPKSMPVPKTRMPHVIFNVNKQPFDKSGFESLPTWIQNKIKSSQEYQALVLVGGPTNTEKVEIQANPFAPVPMDEAKKLF